MRFVPLAIQMVLLAMPLHADDPFSAFVAADSLRTLRSAGVVKASVAPSGDLTLLPGTGSRDAIARDAAENPVTVGVELLLVLNTKTVSMDGQTGFQSLFNTLHAVSTMEGIPYYSISRGKEQVLFSQSFAVLSPANLLRIPDPVFIDLPRDDVLYTVQEDNSFGRTTYLETFSFPGDHLSVKIENLTTVSLLFVPLVQPHSFVSRIVLVPSGHEVLFYGLAYLRTSLPIGDHRSREESLANRLTAMARWLQSRLRHPTPR
jgi:hypothetical protein